MIQGSTTEYYVLGTNNGKFFIKPDPSDPKKMTDDPYAARLYSTYKSAKSQHTAIKNYLTTADGSLSWIGEEAKKAGITSIHIFTIVVHNYTLNKVL